MMVVLRLGVASFAASSGARCCSPRCALGPRAHNVSGASSSMPMLARLDGEACIMVRRARAANSDARRTADDEPVWPASPALPSHALRVLSVRMVTASVMTIPGMQNLRQHSMSWLSGVAH